MKYLPYEQRSREWFAARLGIPCSSEFHKIITPKTMKVSSQAPAYAHRLLAEWVSGAQLDAYESPHMMRGQELEADAIAAYELLTETETTPGNFVTTDDGMLGCSPDRLIGEVGDLELKCPALQTQIGFAIDGLDDEYKCQVQGRMLIHGREFCDLFSYHPLVSIPPIRLHRDEKFIGAMRPVLDTFVEQLLKARELLEQRYGPFTRNEPKPAAADMLGVSDKDLQDILKAREIVEKW